jgi:hypothetical protein
MFEYKFLKLINEAKKKRIKNIENGSANFYNESFYDLTNYLTRKLSNTFCRKQVIEIIAKHFDELFPFLVSTNMNILLLYSNELIKQPCFKEKFIEGIKKYPYKDELGFIFYNMCFDFQNENEIFNNFMDKDLLTTLVSMNLDRIFYFDLANRVNEDAQKRLLYILINNKCNIPYNAIVYKGNNKDIIFDNLPLVMHNSLNLYDLLKFVKDRKEACNRVKKYIDTHQEQTINSIFSEADHIKKIRDNNIKEVIKLILFDVMKNEQVKLSDIEYRSGGLSRVLIIGDKVIKIGNRVTKRFPNNPYIISPLMRKELSSNGESCFIEVTEKVDTDIKVTEEELYELYKNLRNLGLIWTDIKKINVGRLRKENIIHWNGNLQPTDETLELDDKRGDGVLQAGDLVILDADLIYDEKDKNINFENNPTVRRNFEKRYQEEIKLTRFLDDTGEHKALRI